MNHNRLRDLIFLALCCDLGLFSKRLISPFANIITDMLRIPGGIGTSFSLMFLVVAAALLRFRGCAALMGLVQSLVALSLGMVGSMGALSPIGYIVPGIVIDLVFMLLRRMRADLLTQMTIANMLGTAAASMTANMIVFHLRGVPLALYLVVALVSGGVCGPLGFMLAKRLRPVLTDTSGIAVTSAASKITNT